MPLEHPNHTYATNPFTLSSDPDRHALWEMLVRRDIDAFLAGDWEQVASDFISEAFMGVDAGHQPNPDTWRLKFPTLTAYRDEWLRQAQTFKKTQYQEDTRQTLFDLTTLRDIEIAPDQTVALLHKKFDGKLTPLTGQPEILKWQTLYQCRKYATTWKIIGFVGYLPYPMP